MNSKVVSFLVSGRGSNFKVVAEKILDGTIPARFGCVISNKSDAPALEIARSMGIPAYAVESKKFFTRKGHEKEVCRLLERHDTDLVVAAGYMRILSSYILNRFRYRMINIHPALLPAFPGVGAQKQAIEYGVRISGCTAHFIDEGTDTGPIILQKAVEVKPGDSPSDLSKRILR
ncbi:MAG TPA: phosphoribosylglycinamide formyltransferase, partial [Spirochaetota bacterium]